MKIKNITIVVIGLTLHFFAQAGEFDNLLQTINTHLAQTRDSLERCKRYEKSYHNHKPKVVYRGGYGHFDILPASDRYEHVLQDLQQEVAHLNEFKKLGYRLLIRLDGVQSEQVLRSKQLLTDDILALNTFLDGYDRDTYAPKKSLKDMQDEELIASGIRL